MMFLSQPLILALEKSPPLISIIFVLVVCVFILAFAYRIYMTSKNKHK